MKISYRYMKRYREIAHVMIKYGFSFIIERINKEGPSNKVEIGEDEQIANIRNMPSGMRLRMALQELGPTYIKMGQIMSTRRDLFDEDTLRELKKLTDDVEQFETEKAILIIEEETGKTINELFSFFNKEPIAAASIGQVYEAILKSGENVIVKVQRPGIEEIIKADIDILKNIAGPVQDVVREYNIDLLGVIDELSTQLLRELDYNFEAVNTIKMKHMFKDSDEVYIPDIYFEYTTKRVLVMEKINGVKLSDIDEIKRNNWDTVKIADIGVRSFIKQVLSYGFFHADPHPGNIFVINENKIAYIDFGMTGIIDRKTLDFLNKFILACVDKNVEHIVRLLIEIDAIDTNADILGFKQEMMYMLHYYYDVPIEKMSIGNMITEIFSFFRKYGIKVPPQLVTLAKTAITLEGTGRMLNPNFSAKGIGKEFLMYYYKNRLNPKNIISDTKMEVDDMVFDMKHIPKHIRRVLKKIEKEDIKISVENIKIGRIESLLNEITTQLTMALVLAAIIVGSSLIISSPNIEKIAAIRYMAMAGFFMSFIIGFILIVEIIRRKFKNK